MDIPKVIHLIWFGNSQKNKLIQECILSWKQTMSDWEIREWNESTYDLTKTPSWVQKAHAEKKWAFVSDYARIDILHQEGGVYLDTDMYMLKSLNPFCIHSFFIAKEDEVYLSAGVIGSIPHHPFIQAVLEQYTKIETLVPIPKILTHVYTQMPPIDGLILEKNTFYPFSQETISRFNRKNALSESYGVHMWNYSWGPWYAHILHTFPIYHRLKRILDGLGIKRYLKKILGLP